jgi:hypothetical protein
LLEGVQWKGTDLRGASFDATERPTAPTEAAQHASATDAAAWRQLKKYLDLLPTAVAAAQPGAFDTAQLNQLLAALQSNSAEPPEEWKPWLESLIQALKHCP